MRTRRPRAAKVLLAGVVAVALSACASEGSDPTALELGSEPPRSAAITSTPTPLVDRSAEWLRFEGTTSDVTSASKSPTSDPTPNSAAPVRIRVVAAGIDAALDPLSLGLAGELVPPAYGRAGWYAAGPEPGELGRAVIAGHLDSPTGPDVFGALSEIGPGAEVWVDLADNTTARFVVDDVGQFPQNEFPTDRVYGGPGDTAELRLITCGGAFIEDWGGYQDNIIVFAHLI